MIPGCNKLFSRVYPCIIQIQIQLEKNYCIMFKSYTLYIVGIRHITSIASNLINVTLDNNLIITCKISVFTCKKIIHNRSKGSEKLTRVYGPLDWLTNDIVLRSIGCRYGTEIQTNKSNIHDIMKFSDKVIIIIFCHHSVVQNAMILRMVQQ